MGTAEATRSEHRCHRHRPGAMAVSNILGLASLLFILALSRPTLAQASRPQRSAPTAFVDVNVVPMDSERVLANQTVLVEAGKIVAIGRAVKIPADARIIEGHGTAFLSPGLADMHTHADTRNDLAIYLANGVTSVLNMGDASPGFIAQTRPAVNAGRLPGPHVYAAFVIDGSPRYGHFMVSTPDEARWAVRLARTNGYDFIKVYNDLSPECFQAVVDEARRIGMKVVGHGVTRVGLERQLDAGQIMVAHTEEFLYTVFTSPGAPGPDAPDPARIPGVIALLERDHAVVTADLNTYATIADQWGHPDVVARFFAMPAACYLEPRGRIAWRRADYATRTGSLAPKLDFLARFTKAMSDAGVPLVTGTDAPTIPGLVPGFSLHEDLDALEQAGLSRYQVLVAATREPGELIRRSIPGAERFGTVAPGRRADLILTATNPLLDLRTLRQPLGVMAAGQWFDASELEALRDQVSRDYDTACGHD